MLEINQLRAGYGAINVLWDLSLRFEADTLTAIVGPNGAGKTTLLRAIMGMIPARQGSIKFDGTTLSDAGQPGHVARNTWEMGELGLVLIPEGRMVFRDMSVADNLAMGAFLKQHHAAAARNQERVFEFFPRLRERRKQLAGSLSGGEAQMLAIGRAMMSEPRFLLVDEPSLGLSPKLVEEIFTILLQLKHAGVSIVLVEQNTHKALQVADWVYLLSSGKVLLSEPTNNVEVERLHDLYFAR